MADSEHTGGMLALIPDNADQLAVAGGLPVDQLHLTLLYLGDDVTAWSPGQADHLKELITASGPGLDPVTARIIGHAVLNPDGGPDGDRDPVSAYLVGDTPDLDPLRTWATWVMATGDDYPDPPDQHTPVLWHITGGPGLAASALSYTGPVRFSTLRLALADDVLDVPLGDQEAPMTGPQLKSITFTPPQVVRDIAASLDGDMAGMVAEGKALDATGLIWVAGSCGDTGLAWAADMLARAEVKAAVRDMNMGKVVNDGPRLESLDDLHAAIDAHGCTPVADRPTRVRRLRAHAKRLGADAHTYAKIDTLEGAGTGVKSLADDVEVKVASPDPRAARLREEWAHNPKLTKKWRPGTPGDFKRLRRHLAKYVHNPHILNGLTANVHKLATGQWPGKNAHTVKGNVGKDLVVAGKSTDWGGIEVKTSVADPDMVDLHSGVDDWGRLFAEPWVQGYLAALEESDETPDDEATEDDGGGVARTAMLAALGSRLVADPDPTVAEPVEDSAWANLFDEPVTA